MEKSKNIDDTFINEIELDIKISLAFNYKYT